MADPAARSGVSRAMVSGVERGEASPTAALLGRFSAAFRPTLSRLFARVEDGGGRVARASEQPVWRDPDTGFLRRSRGPPGAAPLDPVWGGLPPGAEVAYPAAAYASIADVQVPVLDGVLAVVQGAAASKPGPGDRLRFGPPQASAFADRGDVPCRYVGAVLRAADDTGARPVRSAPEPA